MCHQQRHTDTFHPIQLASDGQTGSYSESEASLGHSGLLSLVSRLSDIEEGGFHFSGYHVNQELPGFWGPATENPETLSGYCGRK